MTPKIPLASLSRDRRAELERLLQSKGLRSASEVSIPRRPEGQPCRASFGQERLWFLQQLDPTSAAYHIACPIRLEGRLDRAALQAAFTELICRHEALRTRFALVDGVLLQEACRPAAVAMPVERLRCEAGEEREAALRRRILNEIRAPFDLASGTLLRVRLIELEEEDQVAVATMHHVAADGWSMAVMVREVARLYEAFQQGEASPLPDLPLQYGDFAEWQRATLSGETLERELSHWKQRLAGVAELELPADRPRPAVQRNIGARCSIDLSPELAAGLRRLGAEHGVTQFMTFLAGFAVLLSRYCGQSDIVIGAPVANRNRSEVEDLIGFFVNTLAIRLDLSGNPSFADLLAHTKERALEALGRQDAPFERIVEAIQPQRDRGRHPVFQTMLLVQNAPRAVLELPGLRLTPLEIDDGAAKFDITLSVVESDGRLRCGLTYDVDLFDHATAERMLGHWVTLMGSAVREPDRPVGLLRMLSAAERREMSSWSGQTRERDESLLLTSRFARQAELRPDALALACGEQRLSYRELREASRRLARQLRAEGVGPESTVGLFLPRGSAAVVAMLATLEAGGAYVPLDPAHPGQRIGFLVSDARTALVLTTRRLLDKLPETAARILLIEDVEAQAHGPADEQGAPYANPDPENLAYMIYTSGSTGAPKGVAISHRSACAMIDWALETFGFEDFAATLAATSFTFDLSIFEIFAPLSIGGAVVLAENALALAGPALDPPVTLVNTVPSALAHLLRTTTLPASVRTVNLAGEPLTAELASEVYRQPGVESVWNLYGPSEDTTYSTAYLLPRDSVGRPAIGRPISNSRGYVLDHSLEPVPVGVPGELFLAGAGLARGYHDRPGLTAERFLPDPFASQPGGRMYRTGDLVRWRPDGQLDFLRRLDHQVKIRGHRIELGEIEARLRKLPDVEQVVVAAHSQGDQDQMLVAYVTPSRGAEAESAWRRELRAALPEYMVPAIFVQLDELPLTPNGKVDRKALPQPEAARATTAYLAPRNAEEEVICGLFAELTHAERVGVEDNFFEIGGHSLLAIRLVARLRSSLGVEAPLQAVFEAPTPAALAERVSELSRTAAAAIPRDEGRGNSAPLSFAQQRLWLLDQLDPGSPAYNIATAVHVRGQVDVEAFRRALLEVVGRHEALRTTFASDGVEPRQVINAGATPSLETIDLRGTHATGQQEELARLLREEGARPFDLRSGPLLRVTLVRLSERLWVLALTMHHIVSDGWSLQLLIEELSAAYDARARNRPSPLPPLPIQYADFAIWQRDQLQDERLSTQIDYWKGELQGVEALRLPTDRPRPASPSYRGGWVPVRIPAAVVERLRRRGVESGASLFMTLLAGFTALLAQHSGQRDIVIGSPIANRTRGELEPLIGFFVNTLAIRARLERDGAFSDLLRQVREACLRAFQNQDAPFERLVEEMRPERNRSRHPIFQAMFVLQAAPSAPVRLTELEVEPLETQLGFEKFDLTLSLQEVRAGLRGGLSYSADLFDAPRMKRLADVLERLLEELSLDFSRPALEPARAERDTVRAWGEGARAEPAARSVVASFVEQCKRGPGRAAVVAQDRTLSFDELDRRSAALARALRQRGAGADTIVAVLADRGPELLVAVLAVLRAGAAFAPFDPSIPAERLRNALADSGALLALTDSRHRERIPETTPVIAVELEDEGWRTEEPFAEPDLDPEQLAYVIHTSGSTGRPKGVMMTHRNLSHYLDWCLSSYLPARGGGAPLHSSIAFDLTITALLAPLVAGQPVLLVREEADIDALGRLVEARESLSFLKLTPGHLRLLAERGWVERIAGRVANLIVGGEALLGEDVAGWLRAAPGLSIVNEYGPTEATVGCSVFRLEAGADCDGPVPIGLPIHNMRLYVLSDELRLQPVGVPGRLFLVGEGLARGYLGRPDLTAQAFLPDPFSSEPGARMYDSGDSASWLESGQLQYHGRLDSQVKIRGRRVELGEIEAVLAGCPGVRSAVVVACPSDGGPTLAAYFTTSGEPAPSVEQLREQLRRKLPEEMIPAAWTRLESVPLTVNGKVDLAALPAPQGPPRQSVRSEPRSEAERLLAGICAELLGAPSVGVDESFFELGGHSLMAARFVSRIEERLLIRAPLSILFEAPSVAALAVRLADLVGGEDTLEQIALASAEVFSNEAGSPSHSETSA